MNNLINIYAYAVAEHLPQSQREDVIKELKATIQDMAANRNEEESTAIKIVLEELGDPALLAQSYASKPSYLIGPKYFALYKKVLGGVISFAFPIVMAFVFITGILNNSESILALVWESIWAGVSASVNCVFWITLGFFAIERNELKIPEIDEKWTIDQLPKSLPARQVKRVDASLEIISSTFGIGFLIYLANVGLFNLETAITTVLILIVVTGLEVIHQIYMLGVGNWNKTALFSGLIVKALVILSGIVILTTPNLINPEIIAAITERGVENADNIVRIIVSTAAGLMILITLWEMVQAIRLNMSYQRKVQAIN